MRNRLGSVERALAAAAVHLASVTVYHMLGASSLPPPSLPA